MLDRLLLRQKWEFILANVDTCQDELVRHFPSSTTVKTNIRKSNTGIV